MRKILQDLADGLENVIGPVLVPRWLHHTVWAVLWTIWILGAIGWTYQHLT